jgi:uncharacterized membrane protein
MVKSWLSQLERKLGKSFYKDEVADVVGYYEEIINERIAQGEDESEVLKSYDIDQIVKEITPEVLMKRDHKTLKRVSKSTKQLILLLLSTPILIPLATVLIVFLLF